MSPLRLAAVCASLGWWACAMWLVTVDDLRPEFILPPIFNLLIAVGAPSR